MVPLLATHFLLRGRSRVPAWRPGLCTAAGNRKHSAAGADERNAPGEARARSPPGASQEAATPDTGRGGATGGATSKTARAPSPQVRKGSWLYLSVRLSRQPGRRLAADVAEGSLVSRAFCVRCVGPRLDLPALFQPVACVVSGSRGGERKGVLAPRPLRCPVGEPGCCHLCHPLVLGAGISPHSRNCPQLFLCS